MEEDHPIKLLQVSKNNLKSVLCLRCAPRAFAGDLFYKTPSFFFSLSAPILIPPVFSGLLSTSYPIQDFLALRVIRIKTVYCYIKQRKLKFLWFLLRGNWEVAKKSDEVKSSKPVTQILGGGRDYC